jgi:cholesterol 7-dehydrogenase
LKNLSNRGESIHDINCHIQDIPENGADVFHFKYVHKYLFSKYKLFEFVWNPQWKSGDDSDILQIFEHKDKKIRDFKMDIYNKYIKGYQQK